LQDLYKLEILVLVQQEKLLQETNVLNVQQIVKLVVLLQNVQHVRLDILLQTMYVLSYVQKENINQLKQQQQQIPLQQTQLKQIQPPMLQLTKLDYYKHQYVLIVK